MGPQSEEAADPWITDELSSREVWIYRNEREAPCRARVQDYHWIPADYEETPVAYNLAAIVPECATDAPHAATAWVAFSSGDVADPGSCRFARAAPRVQRQYRSIEMRNAVSHPGFDPSDPTEIPAPFAELVPTRPCESPICEFSFGVWSAGPDESGAHEVISTWITPQGEHECDWWVQDEQGIYVGSIAGPLARVDLWTSMHLDGVLFDQGGSRVLLTRSAGMAGTIDIDDVRAPGGRNISQWYVPYEEADYFTMGPRCGI